MQNSYFLFKNMVIHLNKPRLILFDSTDVIIVNSYPMLSGFRFWHNFVIIYWPALPIPNSKARLNFEEQK